MLAVKGWEQTAIYDPTNPNQRIREITIGWPMPAASYYWNPVANAGQLQGLRGGLGLSWATTPGWAQTAIVAGVAGLVGYFSMRKWGDRYIKPTLKKIPIVGSALSGHRKR